MTDLIYVNIMAISLDILTVILIFLNQTGISHPIKSFSYILKLKLEFMVLNQLMAVAARGFQKESFAERRYHHPSTSGGKESSSGSSKISRWELESLREPPKAFPSPTGLVIPPPTLSKVQGTAPDDLGPQTMHDHANGGRWPMKAKFKKHGTKAAGDDHAEEDGDEEIGVHMWENRGKLVMEVPWFRIEDRA